MTVGQLKGILAGVDDSTQVVVRRGNTSRVFGINNVSKDVIFDASGGNIVASYYKLYPTDEFVLLITTEDR